MNSPPHSASRASIGHQLRAAREALGLSRPALAKVAGLRFETIAKFERSGVGQVTTLLALLNALHCRLADQPVGLPLGIWLRSMREARRLGQRDAAALAGLTPPTVIALERSRGQADSLLKLLRAYGLPLRLSASDGHAQVPFLGRKIATADEYKLYEGESREWLSRLAADGLLADGIVCDPPYEASTLGAAWDRSGISFDPNFWRLCYDVLKPGAFLLAFAWPRRSHRVTSAIEDAGFEIRDPIAWLFSSGAPWGAKDIGMAIDKRLGATRRIIGSQPRAGKRSSGASTKQGLPGGHQVSMFTGIVLGEPVTPEAWKWSGWKTRLKPGREDIIVGRKPMSERTVEANVLKWGTGALNIDALRIPSDRPPRRNRTNGMKSLQERNTREGARTHIPYADQEGFDWQPSKLGRYPSNVLLGQGFDDEPWANHFHIAKPVGAARHGHPTAKPVPLLQNLVRLAIPPGGLVLDPFAGCASVGEAAVREGLDYIGIERDPRYAETAARRLHEVVTASGSQRKKRNIEAS